MSSVLQHLLDKIETQRHTFTSIVKNIQDDFTIFVNKWKNAESIVNHYQKDI